MKIDETRIPQDGRLSKTIDGKSLDLRVSTLPTVHGEKIVMRIVDKSKKIPELMRGLGSGIKEFKDASKEEAKPEDKKE